MDLYRSTRERRFQLSHNHVLHTVASYGFFAPCVLARDEAHERMCNESTLSRHVAAVEAAATRRPLMDIVRRYRDEILILIRTRIQGITPVDQAGEPIPLAPPIQTSKLFGAGHVR